MYANVVKKEVILQEAIGSKFLNMEQPRLMKYM